jgi:hypothetical protein
MRFPIPPFFETDKVYNISELQIWVAKNEKIGTDGCVSFSSKYLKEVIDYDETRPIRVYGSSELELFVVNKIREQVGRGGIKTKLDF